MIRDTEQWAASMRELSLNPESLIRQKDGKWKVADRLDAWRTLGPRIFDPYLDRLLSVAVEVLGERDPQFDLDPDQRVQATLLGKVLTHSDRLRNGLAETLALLGSFPQYLTSCSQGKAESTARSAVHTILHSAEWQLWASLNDVLPLLAEAAPKEFLDAVEESLNVDPSPIDAIFAQERSGFMGRTYMAGLLWALETLAWDSQYLTSVSVILGELAAKDPGGNWSNRPATSLATILRPWFPQTTASVAKRRTAVATVQAEQPDVAWRLLLALLPQPHQTSWMTRKPAWRKMIPDDWTEGVTSADYWEQVTSYSEMAVAAARHDRAKLATLVDRYSNLPPTARGQVLSFLATDEIASLSQDERFPIWNELIDLVSSHRKFADADWALPTEEVNKIASIAEILEPESPTYKHRRLFTDHDLDLYEENDNFERQRQDLDERRRSAVNEIYSDSGVRGIIAFADAVQSPWRVGFAFGETARREDEAEVIPQLLDSASKAIAQFAQGFLLGRFRAQGWPWIDNLDMSQWSVDQRAALLAYLPFSSETWSRATRLLGNNEGAYWRKTHASPYDANKDLPEAIDRLIEYDRVTAAVKALEKLSYSKTPISSEQIIRALNALSKSPEAIRAMDAHAVAQLIKVLQENPDTNQEELFKIEWAFLALLHGSFVVAPTLLGMTLANNPDFFCEVIQRIFRSDKVERSLDSSTEQERNIATNAYRLLYDWKTPPGTRPDGTYDGGHLDNWLETVKARCGESGHLKIAIKQVGKVLYYAPPDPNGLWLHRSVASVLNAKGAEALRQGYAREVFNSRGVHFVDPEGKPERDLANNYRRKAEEVEMAGYHRLAATLREVSESYDREAEQIASRTDPQD